MGYRNSISSLSVEVEAQTNKGWDDPRPEVSLLLHLLHGFMGP